MSHYTDVLNNLAAALNATTAMLHDDPDNVHLNDLVDRIGDAQGEALAWREDQRPA